MPDNPAHVPTNALILCAYLCANTCNSFSNSRQRVNLSLCHKPQWLILLSWILHSPEVCQWLITCLLHVCSALYCELSACLSCQAVSSGVAGYCCLPDRPSPTPPLLCLPEVCLVRADSWHYCYPDIRFQNLISKKKKLCGLPALYCSAFGLLSGLRVSIPI